MNPNDIEFENVGGGDNEVGNRAYPALGGGGPFGVEIVGVNGRDSRGEIGAAMRDEA